MRLKKLFRRKPSDKWVLEAFDVMDTWGPVSGAFVKDTLRRHGRLLHEFNNRGISYDSMMKLLQEMMDVGGFETGEYRHRPLRIVNRDGDVMPFEVLGIRRSPDLMKGEDMDIQAQTQMAGMAALPAGGPIGRALAPIPLDIQKKLDRLYDKQQAEQKGGE